MAKKHHRRIVKKTVKKRIHFGNSALIVRCRRLIAYRLRPLMKELSRTKYAVRRLRLRTRLRIAASFHFVRRRIFRKPAISDGIRLPFKYPSVRITTKMTAWALIIGLQMLSLQKVVTTQSYFHDAEISSGNTYVSSILDIAVDGGDDFSKKITPQKSLKRDFDVENVGSIPFQYDAVSDDLGGTPDVCNELSIDVSQGNTLIYSHALADFQLPTSTLDLLGTDLFKFEIFLNSANPDLEGLTCDFDIVWRAWQLGFGDYTNTTTLSDIEEISNTVEVDESQQNNAQSISGGDVEALPAASVDTTIESAPISDSSDEEIPSLSIDETSEDADTEIGEPEQSTDVFEPLTEEIQVEESAPVEEEELLGEDIVEEQVDLVAETSDATDDASSGDAAVDAGEDTTSDEESSDDSTPTDVKEEEVTDIIE